METNAESYWGEVVEETPSTSDINFDELFKPEAAECDELKLHQVSSKENVSKESSNQNLASIQPPLDSHGQNLLLHSIELKHHIRKMMLMKMAAQHQQAGGSKNENLPQLPAAPPPPKKYCGKNGIYIRPHQRGFLSNPTEVDTTSAFITGHGSSPVELDSNALRCLTYKAIAAICCHCGYESAHDLTLDVLSDVLADFLKRFTKLLRIAADAEASQRESRFPNVLEYVLQETGAGGLNTIWQYWSNNVLDNALKLQQEDHRLMADYEKLA
ncbi:Hypothetical predicted protein [Paramuricea clavata]|uniref:Bromodomain associated domain-containing protein n=1 Tax=Paramuricea clavata TaxID=317549 RepID=A0A6S7IL77_PARCT|nr:Hypothetical predicted protein [Paramuricea clavata]